MSWESASGTAGVAPNTEGRAWSCSVLETALLPGVKDRTTLALKVGEGLRTPILELQDPEEQWALSGGGHSQLAPEKGPERGREHR